MFNVRLWILALLLTPLFGHAGLFDDKEARQQISAAQQKIEQLQQTNQQLAERLSQAETSIKGLRLTEVLNQLESLRAELAGLRGQFELQTYQIEQLQKRQKDLYTDIDSRMRALEENKTAAPAEANLDAEESVYSAALEAYKRADYAEAVSGFARFSAAHPASKLAPNALYWSAAALYAQKDCASSIAMQKKLLSQFPDSSKAPEALLGIATCQLESKDTAAARKTLQQLASRYPDTASGEQAKKLLARTGKK